MLKGILTQNRYFKTIYKGQKGITGLETAIILIAFVIVASVLAYVVISAGLFSSQKAKQAVNASLDQTGCTVELKGNVMAQMTSGFATHLYLTVGLVPSGSAIDFTDTTPDNVTGLQKNKVTISYSDAFNQYPNLDWMVSKINSGNGDNMLDPGELFQLDVDLAQVNNGAADDSQKIGAYTSFSVEVKPPDGSVLPIERTMPARVNALVNLR
jgi:archaeal flagellin FlaB